MRYFSNHPTNSKGSIMTGARQRKEGGRRERGCVCVSERERKKEREYHVKVCTEVSISFLLSISIF